ncbi:hypothetical protein [Sulfolobus monocaudavirus SMV3]|uniref:hypothetical protein n=1 Tax=Sulfolobus monocaudavirus SMV3 TaxID=1732177 RepID=UPI000705C0E7|nr:hypothetical protein AXI69_gp62 [Sulfolobus monocaudavirus SMV3]ALG96999.1 hypothetical protein [Sulfolobus monocaudavirus SMV3]
MTIKDIIQRNTELEIEYRKALDTITVLEKKIERLERENEKLRKQRDTLLRAIKIALEISNREKQDLHLKKVLEYISQKK